jgi:3-oxoadipate enol-lactonase
LNTGSGEPVTVFAHGLGSGIADTRPLGSGVDGRKVFFQFRGHGRSGSPPGHWGYADLARDLRAVADLAGASRVVGVSLGAGALCRLLAESPNRFERLVFFLPAVLDRWRETKASQRFHDLLAAVATGDAARVADAVALDVPVPQRNSAAGWAFIRTRVDQLLRDGLAEGLAELPDQVAIDDRLELAAVIAKSLVIGAEGDVVHPVAVARELAAVLPHCTLHVYPEPDVLWTQRADLRDRISAFLNGE